jgi:UDP:flavonoid glycosyltransferase YjiC (YdhE family)
MKILLVTWDGAGNLPPMLGTARRLVELGHDVRVLAHPPLEPWTRATGSRPVFYATAPHFDGAVGLPPETELPTLLQELWLSPAVADDTLAELEREPADVVVADAMLAGPFSAAARVGTPVVALFHTPWTLFHRGPLADLWCSGTAQVNRLRAEWGLFPVAQPQELWDGVPSVVTSIPELGLPLETPPWTHHVGRIVEHPPSAGPPPSLPPGDDPLVLVSLSTSQMGQASLLQSILDGLGRRAVRILLTTGPAVDPASLRAPANAAVVRYVSHDQVLGKVALVVTHAGHGTILAALAHGRPVLSVPMGRDQFFLAAQVEQLGAGRVLLEPRTADSVAAAVDTALADAAARTAARRLAVTLHRYGSASAAAEVVVAAAEHADPVCSAVALPLGSP